MNFYLHIFLLLVFGIVGTTYGTGFNTNKPYIWIPSATVLLAVYIYLIYDNKKLQNVTKK